MLIEMSFPNVLQAVAHDYPHGTRVPSHHHRQAQLIHAIRGVVTVNTAEGRWVVPPGRGVWLPPHREHDLVLAGQVAMRTLFIDPAARDDLPDTCQVIAVSPLLRELILAALALPPHQPALGRDARLLQLILDELEGSPTHALHLPWPLDPHLAELCRDIQRQPALDWTLAHAAARLAISERTLSRLFLKETGLSFARWLQRARLSSSLTSLAAGHSVVQVALDHGYSSPSAFAALFRRLLGVPPSAYFGQAALTAAGDRTR